MVALLPFLPARAIRPVRTRIRDEVMEVVHGGDMHLERYREPVGDPGLVGPDSMAWRVHSHPAGMLTGGFAALMLQSLHPLAMAGVDQHSDYRTDPVGRLNRTARYVTVTTFGPTEQAEAAFAKVRRIHGYVNGVAPGGRPYRADDPELLTWVHTAETWCFLAGYQAYGGDRMTRSECDRYYAEVAVFAERLGAADPPRSAAAAEDYLHRMRPQLRPTPAALDALEFLRGFGRNPQEIAATKVLMNGGIGLLPGWARAELGVLRPSVVRLGLDRPAVFALSGLLAWACGPSEIAAAARLRIAGVPLPEEVEPAVPGQPTAVPRGVESLDSEPA
ncbi:MAG TPA: oxygenase MpaB family protein [Actinocrinis sp.]|nr:oxygenase MpaB family protein [Actinocrinis sp.]